MKKFLDISVSCLSFLCLITFLYGCGSSGGSSVNHNASGANNARITSMSMAESPYNSLSALVDIETSSEVQVRIRYVDALGAEQLTALSTVGTEHRISVAGFRAERNYSLTAEVVDSLGNMSDSRTEGFFSGSLPAGIPEFSVDIKDAAAIAEGVTIFGPQDKLLDSVNEASSYQCPMFVGIDQEGEVVWYLANPDPGQSVKDQDIKQLPDGSLLYFSGHRIGIVTIAGEPLFSITGEELGGSTLHHDCLRLPNGHFMALTQESRTMMIPLADEPVDVLGDVIVEFSEQGEIVWSWSSFDHLDMNRYPNALSQEPKPGGSYDWTHANAIVYRESDDSLLLSLRHQNWILKIDHATGMVLWTLGAEGDFSLTGAVTEEADGWFYGQHAPEWQADGSLLLYDNGMLRPGLESSEFFSRGARYRLDETTMQAEMVWNWQSATFTSYLGDADRLSNGNILLCSGGVLGPSNQATVAEVALDRPADPVWQLVLPDYNLYRATRLASFYP